MEFKLKRYYINNFNVVITERFMPTDEADAIFDGAVTMVDATVFGSDVTVELNVSLTEYSEIYKEAHLTAGIKAYVEYEVDSIIDEETIEAIKSNAEEVITPKIMDKVIQVYNFSI
jgi:superfamily II helicase